MIRKGIHLFSGGLDSVLSAKLLLDQGIDLIALHFLLPFYPPDKNPEDGIVAKRARQIGLHLRFIRCGREYLDMAQNPRHGFGSQMNPCIDCKIFFLRTASSIMRDEGGAFVSTGEVIGQRPMSQKKFMLRHIMKESFLVGDLLRPLSALRMVPTNAEQSGIVDRSCLLDITGRGRSRQMELAKQWGIDDYASPAGGCQFTDPNIAVRVRDLYQYLPAFSLVDFYLLSVARHFRYNDAVKFIVSRNEKETEEIEKYIDQADLFMRPEFPGPSVFVRGQVNDEIKRFLVSVITRYGKAEKEGEPVVMSYEKGKDPVRYEVDDLVSDETLDAMRIS